MSAAFLIATLLTADGAAAQAIVIRGTVEVIASGTEDRAAVIRGTQFQLGDTIVTGANSGVRLLMSDRTVIDLASETTLVFQAYEVDRTRKKRKGSLKLSLGRMWARVSQWFGDTDYEVDTDTAVAGVRGTEFVISFSSTGETKVDMKSGKLQVSDEKKEKVLAELGELTQAITPGDGTIAVKEITEDDWIALTRQFDLGFGISEEQLAKLNELEADRDDSGAAAGSAGFGGFYRPSESPVGPTLPLEPGVGFGGSSSTVTTEVRNDDPTP